MGELLDWFAEQVVHWWGLLEAWWVDSQHWDRGVLYDLLYTTLIFIAYVLLRSWVIAPISRFFKLPRRRYTFRKVGNATLTAVLLIAVLGLWIDTGGLDLIQFFGIIGAGLAIALAPVILNFFGWLFILVRQPFDVKDRIQIHSENYQVKGDVIDVRLFMFSVLEVGNWVIGEQSTGRIIHIPNSVVFTNQIANYTQGFPYIWNEIQVVVTFESDWETAHGVLTKIINKHSKEVVAKAQQAVHETSTRFMVYYTRFTPIVWVSVVEIGVSLTMRYLCDARRRRSSEHTIWRDVLREFARYATIDFAYPTQRYYYNKEEGKPGAGGPRAPTRSRPMPAPAPPSARAAPREVVPVAEPLAEKPTPPPTAAAALPAEPPAMTVDVQVVESDAVRIAKKQDVPDDVVATVLDEDANEPVSPPPDEPGEPDTTSTAES